MNFITTVMAGLVGVDDINWKKLLICCTIGAFVIACVVTARQVAKQYLSDEAMAKELDLDDKKSNKKDGKK